MDAMLAAMDAARDHVVGCRPMRRQANFGPLRKGADQMTRSTIITDGRGQLVRLPEGVAFPDGIQEVEIITLGASRLIVPAGRRWDDFFDHGPHVSDDFMRDGRNQPASEQREEL